ncbi:hypothetical protein BJ741DRAFT_30965 [Chytriomyces cf. hyalinus JEL632]|nr:hypothetical protein BJ741DRAFT_30965 [Chytriomyces cf. hyalinus JEL632]
MERVNVAAVEFGVFGCRPAFFGSVAAVEDVELIIRSQIESVGRWTVSKVRAIHLTWWSADPCWDCASGARKTPGAATGTTALISMLCLQCSWYWCWVLVAQGGAALLFGGSAREFQCAYKWQALDVKMSSKKLAQKQSTHSTLTSPLLALKLLDTSRHHAPHTSHTARTSSTSQLTHLTPLTPYTPHTLSSR